MHCRPYVNGVIHLPPGEGDRPPSGTVTLAVRYWPQGETFQAMSDDPLHARGPLLLHIARTALEERLRPDDDALGAWGMDGMAHASWLLDRAASFVTLHKLGRLRGCIGTLDPVRALIEDVRHNALAAALEDT